MERIRSGSQSQVVWGTAAVLALSLWLFPEEVPVKITLALALAGSLWIPRCSVALRPWALLLLGLASLAGIYGWRTGGAVGLVGLGCVTLLQAPLSQGVRALGLVGVLSALWMGREFQPFSPILHTAVPLLGSIFMFRAVLFLKDASAPRWKETLAYFFLFPNALFLLFPVVDYRRFVTSLNQPLQSTTRIEGLKTLVRGLAHLAVFRLIYLGVPSPTEALESPSRALAFLLSAFPLYLQLSGQFHLIVGSLQVCGLDLPPTHRNFFLARGFADFWRRINIYWKEFTTHCLYYPVFQRLKPRVGIPGAGLLALVGVFAGTWFLHSYQWYWLTGKWLFSPTDFLFWGGLGTLTLAEAAFRLLRPGRRARGTGFQVLQVGATLLAIGLLWSLWNSESPTHWIQVLQTAADASPWVLGLGLTVGAVAVGGGLFLERREFRGGTWANGLFLLALGVGIAGAPAQVSWLRDFQSSRLSAGDSEQLVAGYYGRLHQTERFNLRLWGLYSRRPADWHHRDFMDPDTGYPFPHWVGTYKGTELRTNQWGMVDVPRTQPKPPGVFRVAFLGASHVMGSGVPRDARFTSLLERRWSRRSVEVLNFAVGGLTLTEQPQVFRRLVRSFHPDLVVLVATPVAPFLAARAEEDPEPVSRRALGELFGQIREIGAVGVMVYLPTVDREVDGVALDRWARETGFETLSLAGLYTSHPWQNLVVAPWDHHPNRRAHERIATRLGSALAPWVPGAGKELGWNP